MGVKGRRVAVIEELSKTVISFQKVEAKSKERMLTITGSSPDSIQYARRLIEDTIKRNVSPSRVRSRHVFPRKAYLFKVVPNDAESDEEEDDEESAGAGISIETAQDGTLKLCCDDPQMLQVGYRTRSVITYVYELANCCILGSPSGTYGVLEPRTARHSHDRGGTRATQRTPQVHAASVSVRSSARGSAAYDEVCSVTRVARYICVL